MGEKGMMGSLEKIFFHRYLCFCFTPDTAGNLPDRDEDPSHPEDHKGQRGSVKGGSDPAG